MIKVVAIKFKNGGKLYYFTPKENEVYERNTPVIVETSKGIEYAHVVYPSVEIEEEEAVNPLKPIIRIANQHDKEIHATCEAKKPYAMQVCKEKISHHKLDMKLIDCEYTFDGSKIIFFFTASERIDFRELVKDLASVFHIRIELRQIGTRDETKYLGGIAPCGRVCCCAGAIQDFQRVTIKMAKTQGLSINPAKISGLCGRLMCCLSYENDYYSEAYKKMPKIGSEVFTAEGKGNVVSINMLKMEIKVQMDDKNGGFVYKDFPVDTVNFKKNKQSDLDEQE